MKKAKKIKKGKNLKYKYTPRGALGAGTAYAMLAILVVIAAGSLMIGDIIPKSTMVTSGQSVIITTNTPEPKKSNLQLYTFPGATYTPTPSPTDVPQPQKKFPVGKKSGGGSTCFVKGTKILMANGTEKNIEEVIAGDQVIGFDIQTNTQQKETVIKTEAPIRDHMYILTFADNTVLKLSREHPLYTENGWASISPQSTLEENPSLHVNKLRIGDLILNSSGKYIQILSIDFVPGNVQMYNLQSVTGYNDFFANGMLAHNKGGGGPVPPLAR